ncbi:transposase [Nonomuraea jabiensis]|uniref:transposase n=1 Tax=Nonomuraea jabiensis TaxID=882448 RepID=UPI00368B6DEF
MDPIFQLPSNSPLAAIVSEDWGLLPLRVPAGWNVIYNAPPRQDQLLTEQIRRHHRASDDIYGAPRIHAHLRELDGVPGGP